MRYALLLRSTFALLAGAGALLLFRPEYFPEEYQTLAQSFGLPVLVWAVVLFFFVLDKEVAQHWRADAFFVKTAVAFGGIALFGGVFIFQSCWDCHLLDPQNWVLIPGAILMLGGVGAMAYLFDRQLERARGIEPPKPEFLKTALTWTFYLLGPVLFIAVMPRQYANLLQFFWGALTLGTASLVLTVVYSIFVRNIWLQHIRSSEEQQNYQLVVGLIGFIVFLTALGYFNRHPFEPEIRTATVRLLEKSPPDGKPEFTFDLGGSRRSFQPHYAEWKAANPGDS
ncbi:MAG: hypothetical protein JNK89_00325, partial [Saprospiraceae bacterium]|nr:hypothetical protein [Saprospiraceae bacterium]